MSLTTKLIGQFVARFFWHNFTDPSHELRSPYPYDFLNSRVKNGRFLRRAENGCRFKKFDQPTEKSAATLLEMLGVAIDFHKFVLVEFHGLHFFKIESSGR